MRLIFVNRYFYPDHSATAQLLSALAFALAERGWEIHVVCNRQRYDASNADLPSDESIRGVQIHRIWTTRFGRARLLGRSVDYLTFYGTAAWRLWRITRRDDIVVAKTDPPMLSALAGGVVKMRKAKLINWLQDLFPEVAQALRVRGVDGRVGHILRQLRDRSLRMARVNVVLGERMQEKVKLAGVAADRICVISNWECGQAVRPVPSNANRLRHEWHLQDKFVVGYSGNMGRAHEFETAIRAAVLLRHRRDIQFVWIGDGAQRRWLEQQASQWQLDSFIFKPYQSRDRLFESLSLPDVHLISLRPGLEGLIVPSKFYGIAAAGRAVLFVGETDGEIALALRRHGCGYALAVGDGAALASRIAELSSDRRACYHMGERARHAFETNYEKQLALDRWEGILQHVARVTIRHPQEDLGSGRSIDTRSRLRVLNASLSQ